MVSITQTLSHIQSQEIIIPDCIKLGFKTYVLLHTHICTLVSVCKLDMHLFGVSKGIRKMFLQIENRVIQYGIKEEYDILLRREYSLK